MNTQQTWKDQLLTDLTAAEQEAAENARRSEEKKIEALRTQNEKTFRQFFGDQPFSIDETGEIAERDGIRLQFYPKRVDRDGFTDYACYRLIVCDKCDDRTVTQILIHNSFDLARVLRERPIENHECRFFCSGCESMVDIVNPKIGICPVCESPKTEKRYYFPTRANDAAFTSETSAGLTKRQYFAAAALTGLISNRGQAYGSSEVAKESVNLADALIDALNALDLEAK